MNSEQGELYEKIQTFTIDRPDVEFPFSQRLARDNNWSLDYAEQAIDEYKKFIFLSVAAGHPVTPSDQVDQVWHLHLTYTRSYWGDLCQQILPEPLHHDPTLGGDAEDDKFWDWYRQTLDSYQQFFDQIPPEAIWPAPEVRFGEDLAFARINIQQNWVLPKVTVHRQMTTGVFILLALIAGGCYVGLTETPGTPFAGIFFVALLISAVFGVVRITAGIIDFIKDPSRPRYGGCSGAGCGYGCGGCGGGGCGGG